MWKQYISDVGDYKKGLWERIIDYILIVKDNGKLRLCTLNPILKGFIELY